MSKKPMLGVVVAPDPPAPPQAAPDAHDAQSMPTPPHLAPQAPPQASATPPQVAPDVPPPASATPPQVAPDVPPPATATPPQEAPAFPPPEAATPPKAVAGLSHFEPPPPPPKVVAGLGQQAPTPKVVASRRPSEGQPGQSFTGNAQRVPVSEPVKREYLVAVKSYEQQVGANIVRGKMLIESLPTAPRDMPAERRFSPLPGTGYGQGMDMGHGRDNMYAPMSSGQGHPMGGGAPPNVQRSREEFRNLALSKDIDLAKMAEMGPEVRRDLDMGSRIDQILDVTNIPHAGRRPSGYVEVIGPIMAESYGRPPPTGYGAPMGRYSTEACPRDPRLCRPQEPQVGGRPIYEGPNLR
ncbi:uncharacterized protein LOC144162877 [Haemaphysalis longicornis]